MRKAGGELCMLLLLVACTAATWAVSCAADAEAQAPAQLGDSKLLVIPGLPFGGGRGHRLGECWKSLFDVGKCITSIFGSLQGGHIRLSSECCKAIGGLEEFCFPKIFALPVLRAIFPNLLKNFCAAVPAPSPSSVHAH